MSCEEGASDLQESMTVTYHSIGYNNDMKV